jgi:hypothetical protein
MQTWEYKVVSDPRESELNALGEQGWELVGFNDARIAYLKRRKS